MSYVVIMFTSFQYVLSEHPYLLKQEANLNRICADFLSFLYICIAVGDPIIKMGGLEFH